VALAALAACASPSEPRPIGNPGQGAVSGRLGDRFVGLTLAGDTITAVDTVKPPGGGESLVLAPAIIDSHVHLAFWPVAGELADHGVAAAVDLAAPFETLAAATTSPPPLTVLAAGPMITSPSGYPLDAWGPDGFGTECSDAACVEQTVARLADAGARVIKVPIAEDGLDPVLVPVAVRAAHARGLKVAAHALGEREAAAAAAAGCDLLAHTPLDPLSDATVAAWKGRAVISTLAAFSAPLVEDEAGAYRTEGGSAGKDAVDNLRRLRAAGATVLYGTDLGNQRDDGPSADEIELMGRAGMDAAAIWAAMTTVPAAYWGLDRLGAIAPGKEASFVLLSTDPRTDARAILQREAVYIRGVRR
jgi:hypothetical protein